MTVQTRAERSIDKKRQLLDAAERIYFHSGDLGLTVRRIAAEADTTSQTIYTYFGSRDALISAMSERAVAEVERFLQGFQDRLRVIGHDDRPPGLSEITRSYRRYCFDHPARYLMLSTGLGPDGIESAPLRKLQRQLIDLFDQARLAAGLVPTTMSDGEVRLALAAVHGFVHAELHSFIANDRTADELFAELVEKLVAAPSARNGFSR